MNADMWPGIFRDSKNFVCFFLTHQLHRLKGYINGVWVMNVLFLPSVMYGLEPV